MTLREHKNGIMIAEDIFIYPEPELHIRSVTRFEDVRYLTSERALAGMVYCYGDRDWRNGLVNYTGETKNAVATRHSTTHCKSQRIERIQYPLITAVQPIGKDWDTDTRRAIESMLVYKKNLLGFDVANTENNTWRENMSTKPVEDVRYVRDVVKKIIEYELHHLGLLGLNISHYKDTGEILRSSIPTYSQQILNSEMAVKKIMSILPKTQTAVKGWELESGKVIVTEVLNLPLEPVDSAADLGKLPLRHAQLLAESKQEPNGSFTWRGQTPPDRPGVWLSAAMGRLMQKSAWGPDVDTGKFQILEVLPSDSTLPTLTEKEAVAPEIEVMVMAEYKNTKVWGTLRIDGTVIINEINHLPRSLPLYMQENETVCALHQKLLDESTPDHEHDLVWKGHTAPGDRLEMLFAAIGNETSDIWQQVHVESGQEL